MEKNEKMDTITFSATLLNPKSMKLNPGDNTATIKLNNNTSDNNSSKI